MTIDTATNALMTQIENQPLTIFSKIVSTIFEPEVLIVISLIISAYLFLKVSRKKGTIFAITMIITGALIWITKEVSQRSRPLNALIESTSHSFPSGHATVVVVFLGMLVYLIPKKKTKLITIITTLIILLIGFTRIYLRVHWLTDIIAGFVLGAIILITAIKTN